MFLNGRNRLPVRDSDQQFLQRLTHPHLARLARRPAQANNALHNFNLKTKSLVLVNRFVRWPAHHVYANRFFLIDTAHQILIYGFGNERRKRCHQTRNGFKALVQRQISRLLVVPRLTFPESTTITTHVPITELIHKTLY